MGLIIYVKIFPRDPTQYICDMQMTDRQTTFMPRRL